MRRAVTLVILLALCVAAAGAPEAPDAPLRLSSGVMAGHLIKRVDPIPPQVRGVGTQAVMRILIGKDGLVERAYAVSGAAIMRPAFLDAVKKWTYTPYLMNGKPVAVDTTISVSLQFGDPGPQAISLMDAEKADSSEGSLVWVAGRLMEPLLLRQVRPVGSRSAKGIVEVKTRVNEAGAVTRAVGISGPEALRHAAADAVLQWRYSPYLLDGKAVAVSSSATVRFGKQP